MSFIQQGHSTDSYKKYGPWSHKVISFVDVTLESLTLTKSTSGCKGID